MLRIASSCLVLSSRKVKTLCAAFLFLPLLAVSTPRASAQIQSIPIITTVAGNGTRGDTGDGGPAVNAELSYPLDGVALDSAGNIYVTDADFSVIRKINAATGIITTIAGTGKPGYSGDGGPATSAALDYPDGLAFDSAGNLYIADAVNHRIRKINASTGIISTVVGNGTTGYSGDGGAATSAEIEGAAGMTFDSAGDLYFADGYGAVRKVSASTGIITTVAGGSNNGYRSGDNGGPAVGALLYEPQGIALDSAGNLYIADNDNDLIRRVDATGVITTIAGVPDTPGHTGDGGPAANARLYAPLGLVLDNAGNLYIACMDGTVRKITASTGIISTVAGSATASSHFSGEGGAATAAVLNSPAGLALDTAGNMYFGDLARVLKVSAIARNVQLPATPVGQSSQPQTIGIGLTTAQSLSSITVNPSQGNKQEFALGAITGCTVDGSTVNPAGTVCTVPVTFTPAYPGQRNVPLTVVSSTGTYTLGLTSTATGPQTALTPGIITTIAGTGTQGYTGDGGAATSAELALPSSLAVDNAGNLYFASSSLSGSASSVIRKVAAGTGTITTIAGGGSTSVGNGVSGTSAQLYDTNGIALDSAGDIYFTEGAQSIYKLTAGTGTLTLVAGGNGAGYAGDGGPATSAELQTPYAVAVDNAGNLYIADTYNYRIRKVNAQTGIITTIAGNGTEGYSGDGGPATSAELNFINGLAVDGSGNLYLADYWANVVREVNAQTGIITTVAGSGSVGYSGDGGPATSAELDAPTGVSLDSAGNLYISDGYNEVIRKVDAATGIISTIAGNGMGGFAGDNGPATSAIFHLPYDVVLDSLGNLYISDLDNNRIRYINVSAASLIFASTIDGATSSDSPQSILLSDIGNEPLAFATLASGNNPAISSGFTLNSGAASACPLLTASSSAQTIASGATCDLSVSFDPTTAGAITGSLIVTDNALNATNATQTIALQGTGVASVAAVTLSPISLSFGNVSVGSSTTLPVTVTNTGSANLSVTGISFSGTNASLFTHSSNCGGAAIVPSATCTIQVTVTPTAAGSISATMNLTDNATGSPQTVAITGTAAGAAVSLSPATLSFGNVTVGSTVTLPVTVTNTGSASLSVTGISFTGTNASLFSHSSNCGSAAVAPNGTCTIQVTVTPTAAGSFSTTLNLTDNATGSPQTLAITGTGVLEPAVSLSPASLSFSNATAGTSVTLPVTLTNTGKANLVVTGISFSGANASLFGHSSNCGQAAVAPSGTCTIQVIFNPTAAGSFSATMTITDNVPNAPQSLSITATAVAGGPTVSLSPTSLSFGSVTVGATSTLPVTVTNTGGSNLIVSGITFSGTNASLFTHSSTCGAAIAPNGTCTIQVIVTPTAAGSFSATMNLTDNATGSPQTVAITGTGSGAAVVSFSPASLNFGTVAVGSATTLPVTVTNTGNINLTVTGISFAGTNASLFGHSSNCGQAAVAPSGTCTIQVIFNPTAAGSFSATMTITDNATGSPQTVTITGTATN